MFRFLRSSVTVSWMSSGLRTERHMWGCRFIHQTISWLIKKIIDRRRDDWKLQPDTTSQTSYKSTLFFFLLTVQKRWRRLGDTDGWRQDLGGANKSASVCRECCCDNPDKSSQMPKLYLTARGSIPPIHGYLFNNTARGVMQSLSPAAGGLEGKIGQRHLVCQHR